MNGVYSVERTKIDWCLSARCLSDWCLSARKGHMYWRFLYRLQRAQSGVYFLNNTCLSGIYGGKGHRSEWCL